MIQINRLNAENSQFNQELQNLLALPQSAQQDIQNIVSDIIKQVQKYGDDAIKAFTKRLDQHDIINLQVSTQQIEECFNKTSTEFINAIKTAIDRVSLFHQKQLTQDWQFTDDLGIELGQITKPLDSVAIYVPGGKASYPSSLIMNAVPAKVAGVKRIVLLSPFNQGIVNPALLATAKLLQIEEIYCIGGAQAIAALSYGTTTIKSVDKITGPGNAFVAEAKRQVFGRIGIDMIAGPSEVVILADDSCRADWLTMDLFAQAEHDELAQSILISTEQSILDAVEKEITKALEQMPRQEIIHQSLKNRGALIKVSSTEQAINIINQIAPEHLQLMCQDAASLIPKINHAGAIFIGQNTPEAFGDYMAGSNHILPTSGNAKFSSPLGVYDFQKRINTISAKNANIKGLFQQVETIALEEGLHAHAKSVKLRIDK